MKIPELIKEFQDMAGDHKFDPVLRLDLIQEEINELIAAIESGDRVEQIDAICDGHYIAGGTANLLKQPYPDFPTFDFKSKADPLLAAKKLLTYGVYAPIAVWTGLSDVAAGLGFSSKTLREAFRLVHESNMSKFCSTEDEAQHTVAMYAEKGVKTDYRKKGDKWVVLRHDGKVLKSINYKPVNLEGLV